MDHLTRAVLKATSPADILAVVPYLLGFHPRESAVVLVIAEGIVRTSARWDLKDIPDEGGIFSSQLDLVLRRFPNPRIGIVVYSDRDEMARLALKNAMRRLPCDAEFAIASSRQNWWSYDAFDIPGTPLPQETSIIEAEAVLQGLTALPERQSLSEAYEPLSTDDARNVAVERSRLRRAVSRTPVSERIAALDPILEKGVVNEDDPLIRAGLIVGSSQPWIHAWRSLSQQRARAHQDLWRAVLVRTHPSDAAPVFALAGIASWLVGDGAIAAICLEKGNALTCGDPGGLALLALLIDTAVPPEEYARAHRRLTS